MLPLALHRFPMAGSPSPASTRVNVVLPAPFLPDEADLLASGDPEAGMLEQQSGAGPQLDVDGVDHWLSMTTGLELPRRIGFALRSRRRSLRR